MNVNTMGAVFGAGVGVFIAAMIRLFTAEIWVIALILGVVALICYIVASATVQKSVPDEEPVTALTRGVLIGINSAFNGFLLSLIVTDLFDSETAGLIVGLVLGGFNFIASIGAVSRWGVYQSVIGWLNWLMPMSWLIVGLGLTFLVLSLIGHLIFLITRVKFFRFGIPSDATEGTLKGKSIQIVWGTGSFFIFGGWIANCNLYKTAFNMGNFSFVHRLSTDSHIGHESGHSLSLFTFGSFVHLVGAVDEWVVHQEKALTERMAESHDTSASSHPKLLMWS